MLLLPLVVPPHLLLSLLPMQLFSPALSILEQTLLNGYLVNFPGLTLATLHSVATIKGHLDQTRQNLRSTRLSPTSIGLAVQHIMILYDYDGNFIFVQPFHNRTTSCFLAAAYQKLHRRLCKAGPRPKLQRLDNECSTLLKDFLAAEDIDFQLVPPAVHRHNAAKRAIRTFQNHLIAGLCCVDKDVPLHLWDLLLDQAELTLNLLRGSRINPKLLAWAQVNGTYHLQPCLLGAP